MSNPIIISDNLINSGLWLVLKLFYLLAFLIHAVFTAIVIRQIKLMSQTVLGPSCKWLRSASYIYFIFALFCLSLVLIIL